MSARKVRIVRETPRSRVVVFEHEGNYGIRVEVRDEDSLGDPYWRRLGVGSKDREIEIEKALIQQVEDRLQTIDELRFPR